MASMGIDLDTFKEQFREKAKTDIKTQLVLNKISKEENIEPDEQEIEKEIENDAKSKRQSVEDFKKYATDDDIDYIKDTLRIKKTINFLVDNAIIK
jgi:trigger factor